MSFLKQLFEKKKQRFTSGPSASSSSSRGTASNEVARPHVAQTDASRMAGEAALARFQQQKSSGGSTARPASAASSLSASQLNKCSVKDAGAAAAASTSSHSKDTDLEKALELKKHYFGDNKVVLEKSQVAAGKYNILFKSSIFRPGERYAKDEVDDRIEERLLDQLDEEPLLVAVSLLYTANSRKSQPQAATDRLTKCVEILHKFADNILGAPAEAKYRRIRCANAIFKERVHALRYADLVLKSAGFRPITTLVDAAAAAAVAPAAPLSTPQVDDGSVSATATTITINEPPPPPPPQIYEDYFVFEGDDLSPLHALKSALTLAEPIVSELDRDVRVFRVGPNTSESGVNRFGVFDLSDDFYNATIDELRHEQRTRNELLERQGLLRTRAMRERDEHLELRRYNYCLLRVRMPDGYVLQGVFASGEKYEEVFSFVRDCIELDALPFELFSHTLIAGRRNLGAGAAGIEAVPTNLTLAELGLAPAALLNFKWSELVVDDLSLLQASKQRRPILRQSLIESAIDF